MDYHKTYEAALIRRVQAGDVLPDRRGLVVLLDPNEEPPRELRAIFNFIPELEARMRRAQ